MYVTVTVFHQLCLKYKEWLKHFHWKKYVFLFPADSLEAACHFFWDTEWRAIYFGLFFSHINIYICLPGLFISQLHSHKTNIMMLAQACKPFSCMLKIDDDVTTALSVDLTSLVGKISLNALEDI